MQKMPFEIMFGLTIKKYSLNYFTPSYCVSLFNNIGKYIKFFKVDKFFTLGQNRKKQNLKYLSKAFTEEILIMTRFLQNQSKIQLICM